MKVLKSEFFDCFLKIKTYVPFEQSSGWFSFKEHSCSETLFFVDNVNQPNVMCWGRIFHKPLVGAILDIQGEVVSDSISTKVLTSFYKSIIEDACVQMVTYNSMHIYNTNMEIALRSAGFLRPFGNRVCPLTQIVAIQNNRDFDRNWKRNLKKAAENNLSFEFIEKPTIQDSIIVCQLFEELKVRKNLSYGLEAQSLFKILTSTDYYLFYVKKGQTVLCARIVYCNQSMAADVFAANSSDSMKYSATHFLMENTFYWLKNKGVEKFDFSRIPPSLYPVNSVYTFKKSAGGYPITYLGEWMWTKNKFLMLLFCFYNFFLHKSNIY